MPVITVASTDDAEAILALQIVTGTERFSPAVSITHLEKTKGA